MDREETWRWAGPGGMFVLFLWGTIYLAATEQDGFWVIGTSMFGLLFLAIALTNWWRLVSDHNEHLFYEHQAALSVTPLVLLSENMRSMHPEAVKVLERFGVRTSWQVRVDANHGTRTWILENTEPNVHFGFIEHVLTNSGSALYPKSRFSEGSKKWDPDGVVLDRDQYDAFELWMFGRLMVTRSHGEYKPAEFIPPYTPAVIMELMGMTGAQNLYEPEDAKLKELV